METQENPFKHGKKKFITARMVPWNRLPRDITQNFQHFFLENDCRELRHWKQVRDLPTFTVLGNWGGIVSARNFFSLILNLFYILECWIKDSAVKVNITWGSYSTNQVEFTMNSKIKIKIKQNPNNNAKKILRSFVEFSGQLKCHFSFMNNIKTHDCHST